MDIFGLGRLMKQKPSSSSTFPINDLPLEILLEILYKLPVKELHRIKTVCKFWSSLISHPSFHSEYSVRRNSIRPSLSLYLITNNEHRDWWKHSRRFFKKFLPGIRGTRFDVFSSSNERFNVLASSNGGLDVLASSDGLLLCRNRYNWIYYVCNPMTEQWITLPSPPTCSNFVLSGIVCKPSFEFPDDSIQMTFKVVRIVSNRTFIYSDVLNIEIFESTTKQWRVLTTTVDARLFMFKFETIKTRAVELGGVLYWRSVRRHSVLLAFDTNLELCVVIPLPGIKGFDNLFGASRHHIYYVMIDSLDYIVWRYECDKFEGERTNWNFHRRFSSGWIDQYGIYFENGEDFRLLAIDPVDYNVLYVSVLDQVYLLNLKRKQMKEIRSFPLDLDNPVRSHMFVHPTWLISLPKT